MVRRSRRRYLAGVLAVAGLGGCTGSPGDATDEPSDGADATEDGDGPEAAVESYFAAVNDGDLQSASELVHGDSAAGSVSQRWGDTVADGSVELAGTELIEEGDQFAVVRATVLVTTPGSSSPERLEADLEVQTEDGTWKLYDGFLTVGSDGGDGSEDGGDAEDGRSDDDGGDGDETSPVQGNPASVVDRYYAAIDDGDVDTANELRHSDALGWPVREETIQQEIRGDVWTEGTTTVSRNGGVAVVETTYRHDYANPDLGGVERTERIQLRTEDGKWRIYQSLNH